MNNKTMTCPHCLNEVKYGANICTGCKAEITYGKIPGLVRLISMVIIYVLVYQAFILSLKFGVSQGWLDRNVGEGDNGLVMIGIMLVVGLVLYWILKIKVLKKIYKNRINYSRIVRPSN